MVRAEAGTMTVMAVDIVITNIVAAKEGIVAGGVALE